MYFKNMISPSVESSMMYNIVIDLVSKVHISVYPIFAAGFCITIYLLWNDNYWLKQKIPFVEPTIFFGNIQDVILMKRTIGEVYDDIYKKLDKKPLGGFFKLRQPILMIREPELIMNVLKDKFNCFHDNDIQVRSNLEPILKMNPYLAKGARWETTGWMLRKVSNSKSRMMDVVPIIDRVMAEVINYLYHVENLDIDVHDLSGQIVTDTIANAVFGKNLNSFKNPDSEFRQNTKRIFNSGIKSNIALLFAFYAPRFGSLFKFRILPKDVANYFIETVSEECMFRVQTETAKKDYLQAFINANMESVSMGQGPVYKYDQITAHCMTFMINGFCTTEAALSFVLYELALHPEIQAQVREENKKPVKFEGSLLDSVIKESLRLHPPIQTITRVCTEDTSLSFQGQEYQISQGIPVTIPVFAIHKDPQYYKDPDVFRPLRFLQGEGSIPGTFLPFGDGPRACPCTYFPKMILKLTVMSIVNNFEIVNNYPNQKIKLDPRQSFIRTPKDGIWLSFKRLSPA